MTAQPSSPAAMTEQDSGREPLRVVIVQSVAKDAETLAGFFNKRRDHLWQVTQPAEALALIQRHRPDLVMVDLHLPGTEWLSLLRQLRQDLPAIGIIVTNKYPDLNREILAKEQGVQVFLRQPFSRQWVERALARLNDNPVRDKSPLPAERAPARPISGLPHVRFPLGLKIALTYVLLAGVFAAGAAYLVSRYVLDTLQERFTNQLVDVGTLSVDWIVQEEARLLDTLRVLANTQGMAQALAAGDSETVRSLALPVVISDRQESVEVLDASGASLLSMRHQSGGPVEAYTFGKGDVTYRSWPFVQSVLQRHTDASGDKFAGWVHAPWGDTFYVAGPVDDGNGNFVGGLAVGISLPTLVRDIRAATLAQVSLYDSQGNLLATTLPQSEGSLSIAPDLAGQVAARQTNDSLVREFTLASASYSEIVGPWRARGGEQIGLIGSALTRNYFAQPTTLTRLQAFALVGAGFVVIIALGAVLAGRITRQLTQMVSASNQMAQGNLEVKVDSSGDDEVAILARAFNYMVTGLQEGLIYRDLLGRTVSPEVREQLRLAFASGNLRLEGQNVVASVLLSDIRGFTTLSENEQPTTVLAWLNEYFGELVPIIGNHGGVVDKFEGDALLAFFGILPHPLSPKESAYQACLAAVSMLKRVDRINGQRAANGLPPFITGIGVNTGPVTAGGLGAADRLNYTVIGDAVNTAQRLVAFTSEFGTSAVAISENSASALEERRAEFRLELLGTQSLKGKRDEVTVYRMLDWADPAKVTEP